jgi:uncharacterized membrane protein YtjA (UPF0391 family)
MLNCTLLFFSVALLAALFGFTGIVGTAASIAQVLFVVSLVMAFVSLVGRVRPEL